MRSAEQTDQKKREIAELRHGAIRKNENEECNRAHKRSTIQHDLSTLQIDNFQFDRQSCTQQQPPRSSTPRAWPYQSPNWSRKNFVVFAKASAIRTPSPFIPYSEQVLTAIDIALFFPPKFAGTNTLQMQATSVHSKGKDLRSARRPAMTAPWYYSVRRVSPHRRVVNLVRSGRKQPQLLYVSAGGKARHLPFWRPSRLRVPPPRFHPKQLSLVYLADVGVWCM